MDFYYVTNETCHTASGLVIVIDVLRAFSNAAYAFNAGAESITLVSGVEEALALKAQHPGVLVMGEVGGLPPEGFDFGNSPTEMIGQDLRGRRLIQRTGAGTQGVVRSVGAETLFAASFVVAEATVQAVLRQNPGKVTFVITGRDPQGEDFSCAEYLEARLRGQRPDPASYLQRVRDSIEMLLMSREKFPNLSSDLDYCTRLDAFSFAMPITRQDGQLIMRPIAGARTQLPGTAGV
ncbi:MAG: 2-phosphosulfolactate phosphatase [Chloroflexi bacterium]|nr:MAG: 2-phosphosulfolactate phosphatase [Chloroflexota bacterium]